MTTTGVLKGWHVLAILLAFFGTVMSVNVFFVAEAVRSFPGEDEEKSYAQGLKYNATLRDRRAQAALGWRAEAGMKPDSAGHAKVIVWLSNRDGMPIKGARIQAVLRRPIDARFDQPLVFKETSNGEYVATTPAPLAGQWALHARAEEGGEHFDLQRTMIWRTQTP